VRFLSSADSGDPPRICIGQDTRESCPFVVGKLSRGIALEQGRALSVGVLPTPALALLTREGDFDAGLMVSASHNPYQDNGVKVLDADGRKLPDEAEAAIERALAGLEPRAGTTPDGADDASHLQEQYLHFLERCLAGTRLDGMRIVLDTANGAASRLAPEAFRRAGASVLTLGDRPDGRNINEGCGSMHPEVVAAEVLRQAADIGFAFDGDADRCIAVSGRGNTIDGDSILFFIGRALAAAGRLPERKIVATVMSNLGLEKALESEGIGLLRASVGDRYVLEMMVQHGCRLGGEQSGHVILRDFAPTGDGTLTALTLARLMREGAGDPDEALERIPRFPQQISSLAVASKPDLTAHPVLTPAIEAAADELGGDGRLLVRYSGTESKIRVMAEGTNGELVDKIVRRLTDLFEQEIGVRG
jgi:phosphoglucosamine mutase